MDEAVFSYTTLTDSARRGEERSIERAKPEMRILPSQDSDLMAGGSGSPDPWGGDDALALGPDDSAEKLD